MIFTAHIIVGSAVGTFTGNSGLAFIYGIISHHIIDIIPHFDPGSYTSDKYWKYPKILGAIGLDLMVGTIIFIWLWKKLDYSPIIFWGALGGVISDIVDNGPWRDIIRKWPGLKQFHAMHHYLHATVTPNWWLLGVSTQLAVIVSSLGIILR